MDAEAWQRVASDRALGLSLLRLFVMSAEWVVRRVETISFIDERTVRRRVSVDYTTPRDAPTFTLGAGHELRVLPLTVMRKKSLIKFDLRDEQGRALSLLGLRETQSLSVAILRSWAARAQASADVDARRLDDLLCDLAAGDQRALREASRSLTEGDDPQLRRLGEDEHFRVVAERLADDFLLFVADEEAPGTRRVVKYSYDEPLSLRYKPAGYRAAADEPDGPRHGVVERVGDPDLAGRERLRVPLARLGLRPTLVRFPLPAAELAASFHFAISAPAEVSIVGASLLAGNPSPGATRSNELARLGHRRCPPPSARDDAPAADRDDRTDGEPRPLLPSFDRVAGGYPTVDLHVTDVPYGSLSRAQVELQAHARGWLTSAVLSCWLTTLILAAAFAATGDGGAPDGAAEVSTSVLASFAAAVVALLARPSPHRMVSMLLSWVQTLVGLSAVLAFTGAVLFAFAPERSDLVRYTLVASFIPAVVVSASWLLARRRLRRRPHESPWEQYRAGGDGDEDRSDVQLLRDIEGAERPFDAAVERLRFDQPAMKVASSEAERHAFVWDDAFAREVVRRLDGG